MFLHYFDVLMSKFFFKNNKNYFDTFPNKKTLKKTSSITLLDSPTPI